MRRGGPICEVLCRYGRVAEIDYQRDHRGLSTVGAINWGGYQPGGLTAQIYESLKMFLHLNRYISGLN